MDDACLEAERLKQEGSGLFKDGKWEEAIANYTQALERLNIGAGSLNPDNPAEDDEEDFAQKDDAEEDDEAPPAPGGDADEAQKKMGDAGEARKRRKEIARACHLNCAICHVKKGGKEHWALAATAATEALNLSTEHTEAKALYWRGRALLGLGRLDEARRDLLRAAKAEPANKPVRRDLAACAERIKSRDAARRKKRAGFLNGAAAPSMYDEKDDLAEIKAKNALKQNQEEAKKKKKRAGAKKKKGRSKSAFNPGDANDYSKWDCLTDSSDEEEEEAAAEPPKPEPKPKPKPAPKKPKKPRVEEDDSDDEISDADVGDAKGYVRRADGTKTTFFHRDISDREKELIGDITPKAISAPAGLGTPDGGGAAGSKWNRAGTFEERDRTDWCKDALRRILAGASAPDDPTAAPRVVAKGVKDVAGDAAVCYTRGAARHVFDLSFAVEWEAQFTGGAAAAARGVLRYADVDGQAVAGSSYEVGVEYEGSVTAEKRAALAPLLERDGEGLRVAVTSRLEAFVDHFKASC